MHLHQTNIPAFCTFQMRTKTKPSQAKHVSTELYNCARVATATHSHHLEQSPLLKIHLLCVCVWEIITESWAKQLITVEGQQSFSQVSDELWSRSTLFLLCVPQNEIWMDIIWESIPVSTLTSISYDIEEIFIFSKFPHFPLHFCFGNKSFWPFFIAYFWAVPRNHAYAVHAIEPWTLCEPNLALYEFCIFYVLATDC